jgi:hypothetical protein
LNFLLDGRHIGPDDFMKNTSPNLGAAHAGPRAILLGARSFTHQAHPDWIYFLPILHFCACLMSTLRYFVPELQYLSVMWNFVVRVDVPVSMLADTLGPHYSALGAVWIVIAATLWCYLISVLAEGTIKKLTHRRKPLTNLYLSGTVRHFNPLRRLPHDGPTSSG